MSRPKTFIALTLVLGMSIQAAGQDRSGGRASIPASSASVAPPGAPSAPFVTIHVSAVSATNTPLPGWIVRLRDARYGRLVSSHATDEQGTHIFREVDPGSYIIELVGGDQTIRATSALISADAGAVMYAVVRLPTQKSAIAGLLTPGIAATVAAAVTAAGVLAVQPTTDVSPR
jgi:hypothetical protein